MMHFPSERNVMRCVHLVFTHTTLITRVISYMVRKVASETEYPTQKRTAIKTIIALTHFIMYPNNGYVQDTLDIYLAYILHGH